jgi:hypothetical protein
MKGGRSLAGVYILYITHAKDVTNHGVNFTTLGPFHTVHATPRHAPRDTLLNIELECKLAVSKQP